ncbi:hypothetical protein Tco_1449231 [Tanacetum coccineum]
MGISTIPLKGFKDRQNHDQAHLKKVKFEWGDKQETAFLVMSETLLSPNSGFTRQEVKIYRYTAIFDQGFGRCVDAKGKGKTNAIADALSRKEREPPLRVRAFVMTISLDLPKQILNA